MNGNVLAGLACTGTILITAVLYGLYALCAVAARADERMEEMADRARQEKVVGK